LNGIDIWGITVENEPVEGQNPNQGINGLSLYPEQERDFIKFNLGPTLAKAGYNKTNFKLIIFDENIPKILNWTQTILEDKESAKWVSGIAFHWYRNSEVSNPGLILDAVHDKYPEYFIFNSEASLYLNYGNWAFAEKYALDIIRVSENF
jgi:glucosylceramidase